MARLDILLVVRTPPPFGGGEVVGAQLERLFRDRYDVLAHRRARHHKARQGRRSLANLAFGVRYIVVCCAHLVVKRPRVMYIDVPKDKPSFARSSLVLLVALALRVRVVGDLAGADIAFLGERSPIAAYGRWVLRRLYCIRVLGSSISGALAVHGLHNTVEMSNGIADPPSADGPGGAGERTFPSSEARLLYVGKVAIAKGVLPLVAVVAEAWARGLDVTLDVVGEWESDATRERVCAAVVAAGVQDRVAFHGLLVGDRKWREYRRAHLLLHPTMWDGQPVTILEAFATGLPVVATRIGAIPDTVDHGVNGYISDTGATEDLLRGIRLLLRDAEAYASACSAARLAFEERYTEDVFARSMAALLEQAAGRPV